MNQCLPKFSYSAHLLPNLAQICAGIFHVKISTLVSRRGVGGAGRCRRCLIRGLGHAPRHAYQRTWQARAWGYLRLRNRLVASEPVQRQVHAVGDNPGYFPGVIGER